MPIEARRQIQQRPHTAETQIEGEE